MRTRRVSLAVVALATVLSIVGLVAPPTTAATPLTSSITTSASTTTSSEYVTFTATFTAPKGQPRPTETVIFALDDDTPLGSVALVNGVARLRTRTIPVGTHTITATHDGDATYPGGTTTQPVTITVASASTTTSLVSKKADVPKGESAWFQATVAPVAPATATPTGSVAFTLDGASTPAATVPLTGGVASWRPRLADGDHTVTAAYLGSPTQQPSTSAAIRQRTGPVPTVGPIDQDATQGSPDGIAQPTADDLWGQTFVNGRDGWLDQVAIFVAAAPQTGDVVVRIHPVGSDGLPTDAVLGSGRVTAVANQTGGWVDVPLDVPVPVEAGTTYAFSVGAIGGEIYLNHYSDDLYAGGTMLQRSGGGSWGAIPVDQWFATFVTPTITQELTVSTGSAVYSQLVELTARYGANRNAPLPTGTVHFRVDEEEIGTATIGTGGVARLRTRDLALGTYTVTATYDGDGTYEAGLVTGAPIVTVGPHGTSTTLVSRKDPVLSGTAWFQATVATDAPATAAPVGEVAFFLDGASSPAATVPVSAGVATWRPRLSDGPHTVTAHFTSTTDHQHQSVSAPLTQQIGPTPAADGGVDQQLPPEAFIYYVGASSVAQTFTVGTSGMLYQVGYESPFGDEIGVAIHALDQDGLPTGAPLASAAVTPSIGYVDRTLDTPVPVEAGEQYAMVLTGTGDLRTSAGRPEYGGGSMLYALAGSSSWTYDEYGDLIFRTWVRPIPPTTSTFTTTDDRPVWSSYVTLTARWTSPDGGPLPTGTVRFLDGDDLLGTAPITEGVARLRTKALALGNRTVTAVYSGDAYFPPGPVGDPIVHQVGTVATTTTVVSKKTEVTSGSAWFQATVAPVAPATATPTGSVAFHLDGAAEPAAIVPLSSGVASWRPRLPDGTYSVTATFLGGERHDASDESAPVTQIVGAA